MKRKIINVPEEELDMFAKHGVKTIVAGSKRINLVKRKKRVFTDEELDKDSIMSKGIRKLGKIGTVDIYFDEYIEKNSFFMGWRSTPTQESGIIFVPYESMKNCEGVPLPDINESIKEEVLIKNRSGIHFMIGSSEDFEDYKKALVLYMKLQEINSLNNNMYNFIQKGI